MFIGRSIIASTEIASTDCSPVFDSHYYRRQHPASAFHRQGDKVSLFAFWARYLASSAREGSLLDVGCGEGHFLKRTQNHFVSFGLDVSSYGLNRARALAPNSSFVIGDAGSLPFRRGSLSILTSFDLIEHLESPKEFFQQAHAVLRHKGFLVLTTPNPSSFGARIKGRDWFGWRDYSHVHIRLPYQWRQLMTTCGFVIAKDGTDGLWDSPYFAPIPTFIQNMLFKTFSHFLIWCHGFYPWSSGENYVCIARKW